MSNHTIISADYNFDTCDINLYTRDENGERHHLRVIDFEPYFFSTEEIHSPKIKRVEKAPIQSIYQDKLFKITTEKPKDVKYLRGKEHFEADIPFPRRFLIDSGIKASLEIEKGRTLLQWRKIKPSPITNRIRKSYCDIETYSKGRRFPSATDKDAMVTMICLYDDWTKIYLSVVVTKKKSGTEEFASDHYVQYVKDEKSLLKTTLSFLERVEPDIFTAWYLPFDKTYLDERAKVHDITFPWERTNDFDLLGAYKKLYHKSNNELASVVVGEKLNIPNYKKYQHELLENDLKDAILTNKSHVESIVKLDENKKLTNFYWNLKNTVGFESMNETLYHGKLVDIMLLRYYHNKWALPSHPSEEEKKKRKLLHDKKVGGKVLTPPYGVFENLGVFDMSRYYPEMLISQNLSPEPHARGEIGIVPQMALDLIEERLKFDLELAKLSPGSEEWEQMKYQRNSVKYVTETIIGYFGSETSRVYDLNLFNSVTEMGQRGLLFLQKVCNRDGNKVIYGDSVIGETKVLVVSQGKKREVSIEALYNEFKSNEINGKGVISFPGVDTISIDKTGKLSIRPIKKIIRHKCKKNLFEITTEKNKSVIVTEDHSLLRFEGDLIHPYQTKYVNRDDLIPTFDGDLHCQRERVKRIESLGIIDSYVYDIEVEEDHTFLANNIFVHNTDGLSVKVPDVEKAKAYVSTLNDYLKEFGKKEGIKRDLSLKLDRFYSVYLIKKKVDRIDGEDVERGVKKRYAGRVVFEDGKPCDYLAIKGFEYVRRDASPLTKKIQPTVFDFIFNKEKEKVGPFLKKEIDNIKIDTFDDIAIPVTLNQSIESYGGKNKNGNQKGIPPYVRGAIYSNRWFGSEIRGGDQIKMIYVEKIEGYPQTDVISYIDINDIPKEKIKIDIDKMIDQCVRKKIEDVLELIDLSWDALFKKTKSLFEM
jgi:DNA polymerase elongation subunit (family B)